MDEISRVLCEFTKVGLVLRFEVIRYAF